MIKKSGLIVCVTALALAFSAAVSGAQQDIKDSLFSQANETMRLAQAARADVLAPKSFGEATKRYDEASKNFDKGKDLADIRQDLAEAVTYFNKSIDATKLAVVTFTTTITAREDAMKVSSNQYAPDLWKKAQEKFASAAAKLEDGDVNNAKKTGKESEALYRDAELDAIKNNLFAEARQVLVRADKLDVKKYAPVTLAKSNELLNQAELTLNEDRYDTDKVRDLALQAKYEAQHAIYLSDVAKSVKDNTLTLESVLLRSEDPLQRIADQADLVAKFDEGYEPTTAGILEYLQARQAEVQMLTQTVGDRDQRIEDMGTQIVELQTQLGGASDTQLALQEQMKAQEQFQRRFDQVASDYSYDEARVMRSGSECIIRLVGMNFDPGKAEIRPDQFSLLTKVKRSMAEFPDSKIRVEGHTDSYGTDAANLALSEERARAVRQYLLANSSLDASQITAMGYGESHPIANNESVAGRAKNRRIDIVIVAPAPASMVQTTER